MTNKNVLVTGGAGYIGSHVCKALSEHGLIPVTFDNLSTGWPQAVKYGPLVEGDLLDKKDLDYVFYRYKPIAVMHFAALSLVGESAINPGKYWRANVTGSLNLVEAARQQDCNKIVFSSTCATYGDKDGVLINEETPQYPTNSYGASKRAIEDILRNYDNSFGLRSVIFRYFNVAGSDKSAEIGESHVPETHLIPLILDAAFTGKCLTIFGEDYNTPDGTCVRDYVHVTDLADAHVKGLSYLLSGNPSRDFNLGTGSGYSVREVIRAVEKVTGKTVNFNVGGRRSGDAASLVSSSSRAQDELHWNPCNSNLETMITDALAWKLNTNTTMIF